MKKARKIKPHRQIHKKPIATFQTSQLRDKFITVKGRQMVQPKRSSNFSATTEPQELLSRSFRCPSPFMPVEYRQLITCLKHRCFYSKETKEDIAPQNRRHSVCPEDSSKPRRASSILMEKKLFPTEKDRNIWRLFK